MRRYCCIYDNISWNYVSKVFFMRINRFKKSLLYSVWLSAVLCGLACGSETWRLKGDQGWESLAADGSESYVLAVARIKQAISTGQGESALGEFAQVKSDFPEIVGLDLDAFMAAELLLAQGKWVKAEMAYVKFLDSWPDSWLYTSAMERRYSIGVAFLGGQKRRVLKILNLTAYEEGSRIMRDIADRAGDAPIAKRSLIALAESYHRREKYQEAYETWADISSRWPTGQEGRQSLLEMAQSLHSAYRSPRYNSTSLDSARSYYGNFQSRYPELAQEYQIVERIKTIDEQLAYKQFNIAEYYDRTDNMQAANLYYQFVVDSWPETTAGKLAAAKISGEAQDRQIHKRDLGRRTFDRINVVLDKWLKFTEF